MIQVKPGVRLHGIRPEVVLALMIAERIYDEAGWPLVVTSVIDGEHMRASIHYTGGAVDIRLPKRNKAHFRLLIANALGDDFDVVLEKTHIHIEWQPKENY